MVGSAAWNLAELIELRAEGGLDVVAARLAEPVAAEDGGDPARGRRIQLPTGYELNPWADLRPAGQEPSQVRKLWHQSPGSAG